MVSKSLKNIHNLIKAASEQIPAHEAFLNDLVATICKCDEVRPASQTYKPSSLMCVRNMYYQIMRATPNLDSKDECLISMADVGTHRHEFLQSHVTKMKDLGIDCEWVDVEDYVNRHCQELGTKVIKKSGYEFKCFNEKYNMSFLCDGIIKYKGVYYILEIKTESSYKWSKRTGVDESHKPQACCYSLCFGIDKVLFVYENRDTCMKKSYLFKPTQHQIQEEVLDKIEKCESYVKDCIAPPKTENKRVCAYCKYIDICKKEK